MYSNIAVVYRDVDCSNNCTWLLYDNNYMMTRLIIYLIIILYLIIIYILHANQ